MPHGRPLIVEAHGGVDPADAVPSLAELVVGIERGNARPLAEILGDASHGDISALLVEQVAGADGLAGLPVVDCQQADVGVAQLAGQARPELRMHDVAGVEQGNWRERGEVVRILQKERAKLGKVHRISLIDGELRLVRLYVAEVRIDSYVEDDAVFENCLSLAACRAFQVP